MQESWKRERRKWCREKMYHPIASCLITMCRETKSSVALVQWMGCIYLSTMMHRSYHCKKKCSAIFDVLLWQCEAGATWSVTVTAWGQCCWWQCEGSVAGDSVTVTAWGQCCYLNLPLWLSVMVWMWVGMWEKGELMVGEIIFGLNCGETWR